MSEHDHPETAPPATPPPAFPPSPPPPAGGDPLGVQPQSSASAEALPPSDPPARWVAFVTSIGLGLTAVLTAQVLAAIAEGMALKRTEPQGLPVDIWHRIGYAFSSLGGTALLFLVVAVVLVTLPVILESRTTDRQETVAAVALGLAVVMAIVIGVGSILTVRYNLHLYSASKRPVPSFVRIQLVFFLLGALGTAAVALFGALTALGLRDRQPEPAPADAN
ncbi:MAG: hypothetical protein JWP02_1058 [Acidimicrobiales bacterium]|nr:hypothetical protein [Acidimicrobiales bacterium]